MGVSFARINYLTHIDDRRKVVYIETPKVACTSIKKFMMDQYVDGTFNLYNRGDVHDRKVSPLRQISELPSKDVSRIFGSEYKRFSFVRNPFSRLLSGYLDKIVTNDYERNRHLPLLGFDLEDRPTLLEFLERIARIDNSVRDIHFATQSSLLMLDNVYYDFIGRFENFDADFSRLKRKYYPGNYPKIDYKEFGMGHASNANSKIKEYFGTAEIDLVLEVYREDFQEFDYQALLK